MSQDLFDEFSPFSKPAPPDHRRSASSVSAISRPLPPPKRTVPGNHFQGHRQTASSSTFDDIFGLSPFPVVGPRPPGARPPRPPFARPGNGVGEQRVQRPMSYGGQGAFGGSGIDTRSPRAQDSDPFAAFNDVFGSSSGGGVGGGRGAGGAGGGGGGRPRTPVRRDDFSDFARSLNATPATSLNIPLERRRSSASSMTRRSALSKPVLPETLLDDDDDDDDDDFGEFISTPTSTPPPPPVVARSTPRPGPLSSKPLRSSPLQSTDSLPVAPVALLLTLFPPLFSLPSSALLSHLTPLPFPLRQRILSTPEARRFLSAICEIGRVCGRIIVGRQRRRKRVIGRGSATQHEIQTEEREVKEVVRQWRENAGRLKAAMKEAVPELPEDAWKQTQLVGVACRLCALQENELVPGLREDRGHPRWWDWAWGGHGSCKAFWERHGPELRRKR